MVGLSTCGEIWGPEPEGPAHAAASIASAPTTNASLFRLHRCNSDRLEALATVDLSGSIVYHQPKGLIAFELANTHCPLDRIAEVGVTSAEHGADTNLRIWGEVPLLARDVRSYPERATGIMTNPPISAHVRYLGLGAGRFRLSGCACGCSTFWSRFVLSGGWFG